MTAAPYNYSYIFKYIIIGEWAELQLLCLMSRNTLITGSKNASSGCFLIAVTSWWPTSPVFVCLQVIWESGSRVCCISSQRRSVSAAFLLLFVYWSLRIEQNRIDLLLLYMYDEIVNYGYLKFTTTVCVWGGKVVQPVFLGLLFWKASSGKSVQADF